MNPRFKLGDRVQVKAETTLGHHRTPGYLQGRTGVVKAVYGQFRNPESLAYGGDGLPQQFLYCVAFARTDLWETYGAPREDKVFADVYEYWLERV